MMTEKMNLNMADLEMVTGGTTYEYTFFSMVIPDDEIEPYTTNMRAITGAFIARAKNEGQTLEQTMEEFKNVGHSASEQINYYWDKTIPN